MSEFRLFSKYNKVANEKIISSIPSRQFMTRHFDCLFFSTPQATINHISGVTELWLARVTGDFDRAKQFHHLYQSNNNNNKMKKLPDSDGENWIRLCKDPDASVEWLRKTSQEAENTIRALAVTVGDSSSSSSSFFSSRIKYLRTDETEASAIAGSCLLHLFNHNTHHRGQIHSALHQAGVQNVVLDLTALMGNDIDQLLH